MCEQMLKRCKHSITSDLYIFNEDMPHRIAQINKNRQIGLKGPNYYSS